MIRIHSLGNLRDFLNSNCAKPKYIVSEIQNIYFNLTLEKLMFQSGASCDRGDIFICRNTPCVVIGRNQNPWKECNLQYIKENNISLCRRESGGGAVYHDLGNFNVSFFKNSSSFNRADLSNFLKRFLVDAYNFDVSVNKRDDLLLKERFKISGSSAKVSRNRALSHHTLLWNTNLQHLKASLDSKCSISSNNATESVRSEVANLSSSTSYDAVELENSFNSFCDEFCQFLNSHEKLQAATICRDVILDPDFQNMLHDFQSWFYTYGKSPSFQVDFLLQTISNTTFHAKIERGRFTSFDLFSLHQNTASSLMPFIDFLRLSLTGKEVSEQLLATTHSISDDVKNCPHSLEIMKLISKFLV